MATEVNDVAESPAARLVTALHVGDLDVSVTEEVLRRLFDQIGDVDSVKICMNRITVRSLGYGYVNFVNAQDAEKAIEALNFTPLNGKRIQISYSNRDATLRKSGVGNIFVKNLSESADEEVLKWEFGRFGPITSVVVIREKDGSSKCFGFVNFENAGDAAKSIEMLNGQISEMNGKMVGSKPIYVAIAEKREARQTRLQALYSHVRPNTIVPPVTPQMLICAPGSSGLGQQVFYAQAPPSTRPPVPQFQYQHLHIGTTVPNTFLPTVRHALQVPRPLGGRPNSDVLQHTVPIVQQQIPFRGNQTQFPPGYGFPNVTAQNTARGTLSVPSESGSSPTHDWNMHPLVPNEALASALANSSPAEQTKMLGDNLYPLVEKMEHDMAAKVTGMLLEMDQTEVLNLLDCPLALRAKVIEAMEVLRNAPQE
ncbi:hypothetical protein BUALT_Bualt19G0108000 [Buddleja alternifolia]|uniref:Polyadenylate-binding protein n=1 Tax=Buddleja alternifolia TaxID=168488 RepID=A0AAV6W2C8_9LAMI|nr:hypothetical protein BUALT_Bualt19G0108000 [Buddleja alternifolia]